MDMDVEKMAYAGLVAGAAVVVMLICYRIWGLPGVLVLTGVAAFLDMAWFVDWHRKARSTRD